MTVKLAEFRDRLKLAWVVFRTVDPNESQVRYIAIERGGVPRVTLIIGVGREAWRVSMLAVESRLTKPL